MPIKFATISTVFLSKPMDSVVDATSSYPLSKGSLRPSARRVALIVVAIPVKLYYCPARQPARSTEIPPIQPSAASLVTCK